MTNITVTTKTGKQVVLTNSGRGITANIPCMSLDLGPVGLIEGGVRNTFPKMIGGQSRHVEMMFDESQMAAVQDLFAAMHANVEMTSIVERDHATHVAKINRAMNA
jgi:hypothetical protein